DYLDDYGLYRTAPPAGAPAWEGMLRDYGPIIANGCIGAVECLKVFGAGHYVLVIGIDDQKDEIIYLDPLGGAARGGLDFIFGNKNRDRNEYRRYDRVAFEKKLSGRNVMVACVPLVLRGRGG